MNELLSLYEKHKGKVSDKWSIYLREYDRLLSEFKSLPISFMEIGVQNGGSLEIWAKYFKNAKNIIGCDINEKCSDLVFDDSRVAIIIGDACQDSTKKRILDKASDFDIIIEDGSHTSSDIVKTFAMYFSNLNYGGVFIFEDLHCSYWQEFEGGLYAPYSSINFFKSLADIINYEHWGIEKNRGEFLKGFQENYDIDFSCLEDIHSIEFFNSVCVIRKQKADNNVIGPRFIAGQFEQVVQGHQEVSKAFTGINQTNNNWSFLDSSPAEQFMSLTDEVASLTDEQKAITRKYLDIQRRNDEVENLLQQVLNSKSWKITRPLRYLGKIFRLIKKSLKYISENGIKSFLKKIIIKLSGRVNNNAVESNEYVFGEPTLTKEIKSELEKFSKKPLISIIMPVFNVDSKWLDRAVMSVKGQWYGNWELCIVDDKSTKPETRQYLDGINHPKIKVKRLEQNLNISGASNEAIGMAKGECLALLDNDDEITPDALYHVVKAINERGADFIYSDEDKIEVNGKFSTPHFKPDFSPDLLLSQNYISHFCVIKKSLIDKVGGFEEGLEGAQDYDLYLKVLEHTNNIVHIPKVLYHWRKIPGSTASEFGEKSYAQFAGKKALQNAVKRRGLSAEVEDGIFPGTYRVKYRVEDNPLVSIIIPFKDKPELLQVCIDSILEKSSYDNYEIIAINNNSEEKQTFEMMKSLKEKDHRVYFYDYNFPFNYSAINNYAIKNHACGDHVVLLNNDIEIISPGWIEAMLEFSQRQDVGAVGAKLYYPNNTVQHAGVVIGVGGVAGHSHKYFDKNHHGYFSRLAIVQNLSAVTAACLMVKTSLYKELGGLNEVDLKVAFNDVDFCLRLREKGYLNIFTPYSEAYHYESISRGEEDDPVKVARFNHEVEYMMGKHEKILNEGDPYYNPNLTLEKEDFSLKKYG